MKTILFIDGENFKKALKAALMNEGMKRVNINLSKLNLDSLIQTAFKKTRIDEIRYYGAKLRIYKETEKQSQKLIAEQRKLITHLEKLGIEYIRSGNVRMYKEKVGKETVYLFKEKGVDVRLAVDLVSFACDKKMQTAIICSSDSDLQPAVTELKTRGIKTIYLGFDKKPNKGLIYTTDQTVLFRTNEIIDAFKK